MPDLPATQNLRRALRGNALFSTGCALVALFFANRLAPALGLSYAQDLRVLGISLLLFAVGLEFLARRKASPLPSLPVWSIVIADLIWVLGSAGSLMSGTAPFTPLGQIVVGAVAAIVGLFAMLQTRFQLQSRK